MHFGDLSLLRSRRIHPTISLSDDDDDSSLGISYTHIRSPPSLRGGKLCVCFCLEIPVFSSNQKNFISHRILHRRYENDQRIYRSLQLYPNVFQTWYDVSERVHIWMRCSHLFACVCERDVCVCCLRERERERDEKYMRSTYRSSDFPLSYTAL